MGVKSTVTLTRADAEARFVSLFLDRKRVESKARAKAASLTDQELEDKLQVWNDEAAGGEGFENYMIRATPDDIDC